MKLQERRAGEAPVPIARRQALHPRHPTPHNPQPQLTLSPFVKMALVAAVPSVGSVAMREDRSVPGASSSGLEAAALKRATSSSPGNVSSTVSV